ncbi:MAG: hypothetical protein KDB16_15075 [Acidimicrobiales bacterium]|nr:hypothetical protein [Acidimicrobiales bacterium]
MDTTTRERVERGAAWLDRQLGNDWHTHIDLGRLELSDECNCILGQLVSDLAYRTKLAPDTEDVYAPTFHHVDDAQDIDMIDHGFDIPSAYPADNAAALNRAQYQALDDAWADLIEQRNNSRHDDNTHTHKTDTFTATIHRTGRRITAVNIDFGDGSETVFDQSEWADLVELVMNGDAR